MEHLNFDINKLDLNTLKAVKFHFGLYSDYSTSSLSYKWLCDKIEDLEKEEKEKEKIKLEIPPCPICQGTGYYSFGGSFGGPTLSQQCMCQMFKFEKRVK